MKNATSSLITTGMFIFACAAVDAAPIGHIYANRVSANNIQAMQHSIAVNATQMFDGTIAAALGTRAKIDMPIQTAPTKTAFDPSQYGTMRTYGEFNDDGNAFKGRSGGDIADIIPDFHSLWLNWQHFDTDASFNNYETVDSKYDLVSAGGAGGHSALGAGIAQWGVYAGYAGNHLSNSAVSISGHGGYVGVYGGYNISNINVSMMANAGTLYNSAKSTYGTDDYTNPWLGTMAHIAYNMEIDNTLSLHPELYAGYTWVRGADYTSASLDKITNSNLRAFEITPAVRAIKHIGRDWYGIVGARYVISMTRGGDTYLNYVGQRGLKSANYAEYGLTLEKCIDRFNIAFNLNRMDGGNTGWNGGFSMKYVF